MKMVRRSRILFAYLALSITCLGSVFLSINHGRRKDDFIAGIMPLGCHEFSYMNRSEYEAIVQFNLTLTRQRCDCDCLLLQLRLKRWPPDKPKAFIYYLTRHDRIASLVDSLALLDRNFNNEFNYPVVIFQEEENTLTADRRVIVWRAKSMVYFQTVKFSVPDFLPAKLEQRHCLWSLDFRHMCRFHARGVYEQTILQGFDYVWRLDDDSRITQRIGFDVFSHMQTKGLTYGYVADRFDSPWCIVDLWDTARKYADQKRINSTVFRETRDGYSYYNNFEISKLSFWNSAQYQDFINFIDQSGGIYYNRWSDAPIKTIGVMLFAPRNRVHRYKNISYAHEKFRINV